jgi:hypothetical protein
MRAHRSDEDSHQCRRRAGEPTRVHLLSAIQLSMPAEGSAHGPVYAGALRQEVHVSFDGDDILHAETSFAISENPSFEFYFLPAGGRDHGEAIDTNDSTFSPRSKLELAAESPRS